MKALEVNAKDFYERIKALCKNNNFSQIDLCERTGINLQSHKNRIVRNIFPDAFDALKIAQYLNTTVEYLLTGTETISQKNEKAEKTIEEIASIIQSYKASQ